MTKASTAPGGEIAGAANVGRRLKASWLTISDEDREPDRVNLETLERCRNLTRERPAKALARRLFTRYLSYRYGFRLVGRGFRWGSTWRVRRHALSIGHYVFIGPEAHIVYPTVVGDLVLIAPGVQVVGNDHGIREVGSPIRVCPPARSSKSMVTRILAEAWIGQRATIVHGVTIGRGAVIAAGSVVTHDVEPYAIVGGSPARQLGRRFTEAEVRVHEERLYGVPSASSGSGEGTVR